MSEIDFVCLNFLYQKDQTLVGGSELILSVQTFSVCTLLGRGGGGGLFIGMSKNFKVFLSFS